MAENKTLGRALSRKADRPAPETEIEKLIYDVETLTGVDADSTDLWEILNVLGRAVIHLLRQKPEPTRHSTGCVHNWDVVTEETQAMTKAKPFLYQYLRCVVCGERREIPEQTENRGEQHDRT
ncbi:hypothetical protein [Mycetocola tolaasinivorans]|nr:hypothetical protein [Mycetocola tolaasinivorans]